MRARSTIIALAPLVLALSASAQNFNIDMGDPTIGLPTSAYGGAAGQTGMWFGADGGFGGLGMLDVTGTATLVDLIVPGSSYNYASDNPLTTGDDELLMDDFADPGLPVGAADDYIFYGLADGSYSVYTYGWASDGDGFRVDISVAGAVEGAQTCGGAWPGGHALGVTYTLHHVDVVGGTLTINCLVVANYGSMNGFQLVLDGAGSVGTNYCTSNANSTGAPALIYATGSGSVAANDLVLNAGPVPNQPGIFFYANNQLQVPFGNGFLCAAGTISRLPVVVGSGNLASFSVDYGSVPATGPITSGSDWNFQFWYRDPAGGGAFFNTSDGLNIIFVP